MTTIENEQPAPPLNDCLTDVPGIELGHAQSDLGHTGCSVILMPDGCIAGVDIGGSAPGLRETEMLKPTNMVMRIHALLFTGGSTLGLNAAGGVQAYLQEREIGFRASTGVVVPIVPAAVIFDLDVGKPQVYPDRAMGHHACLNAGTKPSRQGPVGAGIGATCGKVLGSANAMRGGLGTASVRFSNGVVIAALAVCNAWGDVLDPETGKIVAGARAPGDRDDGDAFLDTSQHLAGLTTLEERYFGRDTTLCAVATNATFSREEATKLAMMAQDGIARAVKPSHTLFDGDVVFALSTCTSDAHVDVTIAGSVAADLVSRAIVKGVVAANLSK